MPDDPTENPATTILDPEGRPARDRVPKDCPRCGAPPTRRRLSGGFGQVHDLCGVCGFEFEERTLW